MSRMLCGISDDPYNDYSDYIEGTGVYKQRREELEYCIDSEDIFEEAGAKLLEAEILLTHTMLHKSIMDANQSVIILTGLLGVDYKEMQAGDKHSLPAIFYDGTPSQINFYKTKRGDKRLSVKNLKSQADVGQRLLINLDCDIDMKDIITLEVI